MRLSVAVAAVCLSIIGLATADDVRAAIRKPTNIPAESLGAALQELARDRNFQIVYVSEEVNSLRTEGAVGEFNTEEALKQLLKGTGMTYRYLDEKTVTILPASAPSAPSGSAPTVTGIQPSTSTAATDRKEAPDATAQRFLVAQATSGRAAGTGPVESQQKQTAESEGGLQEVVVTAQKKSENLLDVPVPVTAIAAQALIDSNELRLQDYYTMVPGLDVTPARAQYQVVSIRGVTTGALTNPTVGITIDDVPYGSSTDLGGAAGLPDIDPFDLARVEVLRGPQVTLYGASSMGGLIKFVTADPSTEGFSGRIEADTNDVHNGAELGYGVRGGVNVPAGDTLAARLSVFTRQDPGYIDNPVLHINGVNQDEAYGGHLSALWRPSEDLSIKVSALAQKTDADGHSEANPSLGDLKQNFIPGVGKNSLNVQAYSATLNAKLGIANLTVVSGYNQNTTTDSVDYSAIFGTASQAVFNVSGDRLDLNNETKKFNQEIRLAMPIGQRVDWLLGGYYTHESSSYVDTVYAENASTGQIAGVGYFLTFPTTYEEYAGFSDLTFQVTDKLDVQIGGRESHIDQTHNQLYTIALFGLNTPIISPEAKARANAFTYLLTPRYKISSDLMIYARLASGYRAGGTNPDPLHPQFDPDKTQDYELGFKGDFLGHALTFDASIYYIDWKSVQITLIDVANHDLEYTTNGGTAKSQGVEFSVDTKPLQGLTVELWATYDDAVLTQDLPTASTAFGVAGDRLPYTSRFSGHVSLEQGFPITNGWNGFVGGALTYTSDRKGDFTGDAVTPRVHLPAYATANLRAGIRYESWSANLFVNNVADRRGILAGGDFFPLTYNTYIQPRTVGLTVAKTF